MASKDHFLLEQAYSKVLYKEEESTQPETEETPETETPEDDSDVSYNTELGGHSKSPTGNQPASEIKSAIKELLRYKRPSHDISDEVIDSMSEEELEEIQDFLDQKLDSAKIKEVAHGSSPIAKAATYANTGHYMSGL